MKRNTPRPSADAPPTLRPSLRPVGHSNGAIDRIEKSPRQFQARSSPIAETQLWPVTFEDAGATRNMCDEVRLSLRASKRLGAQSEALAHRCDADSGRSSRTFSPRSSSLALLSARRSEPPPNFDGCKFRMAAGASRPIPLPRRRFTTLHGRAPSLCVIPANQGLPPWPFVVRLLNLKEREIRTPLAYSPYWGVFGVGLLPSST